MLKLNNGKLHYAIKQLENKAYAFTRSYDDDIAEDSKMLIGGVIEVSAWFNDSKKNIINDLKSCGFNEFDQLKASQYMAL